MMTTKVKKRVAHLLKRWPTLYRSVANIYSTLKPVHLMEHLVGTRVREREWSTRHLRKSEKEHDDWNEGSNDWIKGYWYSQNHSHRPFLIEKISNFSPSSILEIGCNCGPNLYLLGKKFPDAEIRGVDINPLAVQKGNEWLAQEGISNVKLLKGKADELRQFQDKSFDIVFTDAVLIYVGPDKIKEVIRDMVRITRRALILVEWHSEYRRKDPDGLGVYYLGNWKRDYVALLKQFVREEQIHVTKITEDVWPDRAWKDVGAVIEVVMESGM